MHGIECAASFLFFIFLRGLKTRYRVSPSKKSHFPPSLDAIRNDGNDNDRDFLKKGTRSAAAAEVFTAPT